MKTIKNTSFILVLAMLATLSGCKKKSDPAPEPSAEQKIIEGLSKAWTVNAVRFEGEEVSADWKDLVLTFKSDKKYSATALSQESILVWPANGSYTFPDKSNAKVVLRNDGVQITIENLTENSARLTFKIAGRNTGGRITGLIGEWAFEMKTN